MNATRVLATLLCAGWLLIPGVAAAQPSSPLEQIQEQIQALLEQGKSAEVEMFLKQVLTLAVLQSGPDGEAATEIRLGLAWVYAQLFRFEEAEQQLRRALEARQRTLGPDHALVADLTRALAHLIVGQGRYHEAEPLAKTALRIMRESYGPEHPKHAEMLSDMAGLLHLQGRLDEAEPLYRRALAITEKAMGPDDVAVAEVLSRMAMLSRQKGRYGESESMLLRVLSIQENAYGRDSAQASLPMTSLGDLYVAQRRLDEAEPLLERSLAINERLHGVDAIQTSDPMILLSYMNWAMGRFDAAVRFATRSLAISRAVLGDDSPDVAFNLTALAVVLSAQGRPDQAIEKVRAATAIHRGRKAAGRGLLTIGLEAEQKSVRFVYLWHAAIAHRLMAADPSQRDRLLNESFEVVQLARATGASKALASMAARFAVGDDELARLVRERQKLLDSWRRIDKAVIAAAASRSARDGLASDAEQRRQLQAIRRDVAALDARISSDFPEYAEIADPLPLTLDEARALLAGDEALVTFAIAGDPVREMADRSFVHVLRRDRADFYEVAIGGEELAEAVALLRTSLGGDGIATLGELLTRGYESETAFALYRRLLAPAEPLLAGVRHVFMVPDGPLQSLPLGVLLTEAPQAPLTDFAGYRQAPWLARRYAMTVLPSVSSLKALRRFARTARSRKPFMGFGDPVLEGRPGDRRGIRMAGVFRGARADVTALRRLPPLPETADELRAIAAVLNAGDGSVFLGRQATETTVRNTDLSDRRIVAFATHGLVAGQIEGQGEPGLVLTPPDVASEADDGLLTASEIARYLELDADWVILSACNTAAGDAPGAEGLSGLAKAFFYAGARALLVSHWSVQSEAAVGLTTRMLAEAAEHPEIGGAEALKRSMLALMEDPENPHFAHPMFWAPFVVVGEGGAGAVPE